MATGRRPAGGPRRGALLGGAQRPRRGARPPRRAGADPNADVYRGTALAWAAAGGRARAIRRLVELGADPNRGATFGGSQHGEGVTALHLAAQTGQIEAIRALLDAGADPSVRDALHDGTPADWAAHGGHEEARALLATAPRPGA